MKRFLWLLTLILTLVCVLASCKSSPSSNVETTGTILQVTTTEETTPKETNSEEPATEGIIYRVSADGTYAEVVGYSGTDTQVLIAEEYQGLPVKMISQPAFKGNRIITSVIIPDSVTSIGDAVFAGCTSLKNVTIGDSVTNIGWSAFTNCTALTSITIPDSVTVIGRYAFSDCSSLAGVAIGDGVTSIGHAAFDNCRSLTRVYITNLTAWCNIDFESFSSNPLLYHHAENLYLNGNLITDLVIPDGVTSIGSYTFYGCDSLTNVTIPDSVTSIGCYAFYGCDSLKSVTFSIPNGWWRADYEYSASGTDISVESLSDPSTAAECLRSTFYDYYWFRTE